MRIICAAILLLFAIPATAQTEETIDVEEIEKEGPEHRRAPMLTTTVSRDGDRLTFHYEYFKFAHPYVADGDERELLELTIELPQDSTEFHLENGEEGVLRFKYYKTAKKWRMESTGDLKRWELIGRKIDDHTWVLHFSARFPVKEFPSKNELDQFKRFTEEFTIK